MKSVTLGLIFLFLVIGTKGDWSSDRRCLGGAYYTYLKSIMSVFSMGNFPEIDSYASDEDGYAKTTDLASFEQLTSGKISVVTTRYDTLTTGLQDYQKNAIKSSTKILCEYIRDYCKSYWTNFPSRSAVKSVYETYGSGSHFTSICGRA